MDKNKLLILIIILIIILIYILDCRSNDHFTQNQIIEKNIFQTAWSKNLPKKYTKLINKLKKQNPEYKYHLFDDDDMNNFVRENYPKYWETFNMINPEYIVAKADYFRYMVVYHYGGVYLDLKSGANVPLRKIINPDDSFIITNWITKFNIILDKVINWCIISKKGHPLLKKVLDTIHDKILNYDYKKDGYGNKGVFNLTGPKLYEKVIYKNIDKYNITVYTNLINNKLVYNHFNTKSYHFYLCTLYNHTNGKIGYCTHTAKKKKYSLLKTPIVNQK